jgi:hypothetical protein
VPSPGDSGIVGAQQISGDGECIADTDSQLRMQFASERQVEERSERDAPCHSPPLGADVGDVEVGEQVVQPFERCIDHKCRYCNAIGSHIMFLIIQYIYSDYR